MLKLQLQLLLSCSQCLAASVPLLVLARLLVVRHCFSQPGPLLATALQPTPIPSCRGGANPCCLPVAVAKATVPLLDGGGLCCQHDHCCCQHQPCGLPLLLPPVPPLYHWLAPTTNDTAATAAAASVLLLLVLLLLLLLLPPLPLLLQLLLLLLQLPPPPPLLLLLLLLPLTC